tara:strand:+ start:937 stop:1683 length:747 start_codon:yes stop_codon:yes gene_type:complete
MKNEILNELKGKGVFVNNYLLNDLEKKNLINDFSKIEKNKLIKFNEKSDIKNISSTLYNFLQRDYIYNSIYEYLGSEIKYSSVIFTKLKPEIKKKDSENISAGSTLAFHNDDSGKQIKINILLTDLEKGSNGLEYAISSNKISLTDKLIINFFNIFGRFKGWDKHFINYHMNKIKGRNVNFMSESKVKKKFKILKVFGKSGLVYIFDTNGFHRQSSVAPSENLDLERDLITIYLDSQKKNKTTKKEHN